MKKRLLFLVANDRYFCTHRLPLALEAQKNGYDVTVMAPALGDHEKIIDVGLKFVPLAFDRGSLNPIKALKTLWQIIKIYKEKQPHLVHLVALKPVLLGTLAARITGVPLIVNAISGLGHVFASNSWLKHPLRFLLKIVLTSKHVHVIVQNPEDMHEIGPLALANHTHLLLGAGVNTDVFKPKEEPFCPPFVVSHVSRLLWSKGVGDLVEAARLLKQKGIPIHVQVVGLPDKENPNSIPEHVLNQWHGEGLIAWLGQQDNIEEIYQQSHVAVLASYYREGIPKSLLEALACGKPIVTCHMPGCRLTVQNGRNGFLIPPKSAEELARVLEILYKNPKKRQTMGKKSRSMALKYFSDHTIHKQTLRIYRANF